MNIYFMFMIITVSKGLDMLRLCHYLLPHQYLVSIYNAFIFMYLDRGVEHWDTANASVLNPLFNYAKTMHS